MDLLKVILSVVASIAALILALALGSVILPVMLSVVFFGWKLMIGLLAVGIIAVVLFTLFNAIYVFLFKRAEYFGSSDVTTDTSQTPLYRTPEGEAVIAKLRELEERRRNPPSDK